jgi:hypothetical protein
MLPNSAAQMRTERNSIGGDGIAGVMLAPDLLAYDELRTGRLVIPVELALRSGQAFHLVCAKGRREHPHVRAFNTWIKQELATIDWRQVHGSVLGRNVQHETER